jgi:PAS domain S-box-containing protein
MSDFLRDLFDTSGFPPRWNCGSWTAAHGWLHILSDLGIWSAYVAIPCVLVYFLLRRRDLPFRLIFMLFGAFILFCGTTHLMEAILFWWPAYRLAGVIKLLTALVSWSTVLALVPVTPKALAMRSPEDLQREIDARKQAENALLTANNELERRVEERTAALRESEERYRLLVEMSSDAILINAGGKIVFANSAAARLLGKQSPKELLGTSQLDSIHPDLHAIVEERWQQAVANGETAPLMEQQWVRADGSIVEVEAMAYRFLWHGEPQVKVIARDISARKRAEEALHRQQEWFRVTLASIGDAVITTDREGRVTFLNRIAQTLTGWTEADAL